MAGTTPNRGELGSVLGKSKIGVLLRLKAEALNWKRGPSRRRNVRTRVASSWGAVWRRMLGLRRGAERSVSAGRCTQIEREVSDRLQLVADRLGELLKIPLPA